MLPALVVHSQRKFRQSLLCRRVNIILNRKLFGFKMAPYSCTCMIARALRVNAVVICYLIYDNKKRLP